MSKKVMMINNFSKIGENITTLMKHCDIDAVGLSKITGLPTSTISRLRSNTNDFSPNISSLIPIARYFEISVSQLIGEEALPDDICGSFKANNIKKRFIPILQQKVIQGFFTSAHSEPTTFISVDLPVSSKSYACYMQGDAMDPQIPEKTLLIIEPELIPANRDFVLVASEDKALPMLRQLLIEGKDQYLRTLNPVFNEFVKISKKNYQILGTLVEARMNFRNFASQVVVAE